LCGCVNNLFPFYCLFSCFFCYCRVQASAARTEQQEAFDFLLASMKAQKLALPFVRIEDVPPQKKAQSPLQVAAAAAGYSGDNDTTTLSSHTPATADPTGRRDRTRARPQLQLHEIAQAHVPGFARGKGQMAAPAQHVSDDDVDMPSSQVIQSA
jgi:hypothetical protein